MQSNSMTCIYRKPKTHELCNICVSNSNKYCKKHNQYANIIYEIFYDVMRERNVPTNHDVFKIFKYIQDIHITDIDNGVDIDELNRLKKDLFYKTLDKFSRTLISNLYQRYYNIEITSKNVMINALYHLNFNTYNKQGEIDKIDSIKKFFKNVIKRSLSEDIRKGDKPMNDEDPFSYDDISELPGERIFAYKDNLGHIYAFDALELEYFVRKCRSDGVDPYNPYTREIFSARILYKLELFIKYNSLQKKNINNDHQWITELQAFTDLSIEIERRGFYNSPDWFLAMNENVLLKVVKLFKNFSADIDESYGYFVEYKKEGFIFDFCKEGIKLFRECSEDKFILCCNFMKALGLCSSSFYRNLPSWLSNTQTSSRIEHLFDSLTDEFMGFNIMNNAIASNRNNHNFLLYYYVEHMQ